MTTLLHISASPRGLQSESLALARTFVDAYRECNPDDRVVEWDLWDGALPQFGPAAVEAKMAVFGGQEPAGAAGEAWRAACATFARFAAADKYLFSVPMWNASVPYILKQFMEAQYVVAAYDPTEAMQTAAYRAFLGEIVYMGELPVRIS